MSHLSCPLVTRLLTGLQRNDYNSRGFKRTSSVLISWIGHPGDSPVDARARPFIVSWDPGSGLSEAECGLAVQAKRPVLRWEYVCAGIHDVIPKSKSNRQNSGKRGSEYEDEQADAANEDEAGHEEGEEHGRWERCSYEVRLRVSTELSLLRMFVCMTW